MIETDNKLIRIAILDLYEGTDNQGMRCIREILDQFNKINQINLVVTEFEVRIKQQVPELDFDIYISSGGPGSPLDSKDSVWENKYFDWLQKVVDYNANENNVTKKNIFFICHSFQLACRFFNLAKVTKRKSTAFGVFPMHYLNNKTFEKIFSGLKDPFYAVDSRDYQVIQPDLNRLQKTGAQILAIEKARPHVPYERAVMAIRFNENMIGTQFHPEADAVGMIKHLYSEEKKKTVIDNHGEAKWQSMIEQLNDPEKIMNTYNHILPNFLLSSVNECLISKNKTQ
jgi:GMP synthase-like glutamine amidotransferase